MIACVYGRSVQNPFLERRQALLEFKRLYNEHWLIERHGCKTPLQVRKERLELQKAA